MYIKQLFTTIILFMISLNSWGAFTFVDRPISMGKQYPDTITCRVVHYPAGLPGVYGADCAKRLEGLTGMMEVLVKNPNTGRTWVRRMPSTQPIECVTTYCKDREFGQLIGYNHSDVKWSFKVPYGWYVVIDEQNTITMYRRGTGPHAQQITQYVILSEQSQTEHSPTPDFDLYCSPQSDTCRYTDAAGNQRDIPRDQLEQVIPYAVDTTDCLRTFCYGPNNDIIGLNPDW